MRTTGIEIIGDAPWGTHFCQFYKSRQDLADLLIPYFKAGLEHNEFCMWITTADFTTAEAEAGLRQAVPDFEQRRQAGQIEILPHTEWYLHDGLFDLQRVLDGWIKKLDQAVARGFAGLRLSGNTVWLEKQDWKGFADYEQAINEVIGRYRILALCTYSLQKCGAIEILDVVRNHQFALIKSQTGWELIESSDDQRRQAEAKARRQNELLTAIARVFQEGMTCRSEQELGRICLAIAQDVTNSSLGFIAEVNPRTGRLEEIALSDTAREACRGSLSPQACGEVAAGDLAIEGLCGRVLKEGKSIFTNDPPQHREPADAAVGHPRVKAFLGTPLQQQGNAIGLIGLANRQGGYRPEQLEDLEALAPAIMQVMVSKRIAEALRKSEEQLRLATQAANIGVWSWEPGTSRVIVSANWRNLFGVAADETVTFETWQNALHPDDREWVVRDLQEASEQHREFNTVYRVVRPDGTQRWMIDRGRAWYDEQDRAAGMAGVNVDITEQKEAQQVLARSKDELEALVRERTGKLEEMVAELEHFSYTITHDMRAPLRSMQGFADLMRDACAGCSQREPSEFLGRIRTSAARMDLLITDALNYSRAVQQELKLSPVDPEALLRGMLDSYPECHPARARIHIDGALPRVLANPAGLTQCFSNLLSNAVKFVKRGEKPDIRIHAEGREGWVRIWVDDHGIGIPTSMQGRIFDMFARGHPGYEGTGIGLALVRKVMERMGGKAGVRSEEGKGSCFWLDLKAAGQNPASN